MYVCNFGIVKKKKKDEMKKQSFLRIAAGRLGARGSGVFNDVLVFHFRFRLFKIKIAHLFFSCYSVPSLVSFSL